MVDFASIVARISQRLAFVYYMYKSTCSHRLFPLTLHCIEMQSLRLEDDDPFGNSGNNESNILLSGDELFNAKLNTFEVMMNGRRICIYILLVSLIWLQPGSEEHVAVVLDRATLRAIPRTEIHILRWPAPLRNQYFKAVLTDVNISVCPHCNKVEYK